MDFRDSEEDWRQRALPENSTDNDGQMDPDPSGYYAALGVSQNATQGAIRQAFLHLSQCYHTDKHPGESEEALEIMKERFQHLQEAYRCLSDERQRAAYDAGGADAINRLALIPNNITQREDIVRYLNTLEREQEVLRMEKMFSSSSMSVIAYSIAHLFTPWKAVSASPTSTAPPKEREEGKADHSSDVEGASTSSSGGAEGDGSTAVTAQFTAKEIEVDGLMQIVLIPSGDVQDQLRKRIAGSTPSSSATSTNTINNPVQKAIHAVARAEKLLLAVLPRELYCRYSFRHIETSTLSMQFRVESFQNRSQMYVGCTAVAVYQPDIINAYTASYTISPSRLKITLDRVRTLGKRWSIRGRLVLLNGFNLFSKYELILRRRLSPFSNLESTLCMSAVQYGFFKTAFYQNLKNGVLQSLNFTFGYRRLGIQISREAPVMFGGIEVDDQKIPRGRLGQTMHVVGFSGVTRVGFEAWYYVTKWHHVGIGFSTDLPLSVNPIRSSAPTHRFSEFSATNEVSLLYERGNHLIKVPIIAFVSTEVQKSLLWLMTPLMLYSFARLAWRPIQRTRTVSLYRKYRLENVVEMDLARTRAIHEQRILEKSALYSHLKEESIAGLVIINAKYGVLNPRYPEALHPPQRKGIAGAGASWPLSWWGWWKAWGIRNPKPPRADRVNGVSKEGGKEEKLDVVSSVVVLDVTTPLQHLVRDSKLILPMGSKSKLVGFTDPDPFTGEPKELKIVYWFQRKRHVTIVNDMDPVELPRREHLIGF